ncbi:unnamed protein product, partial [Mesorhabditis spiculigera]
MSDAPFSFGNKFWVSLNLKVTRIANPADIPSFKSLRKFLGLFHASQLVCQHFIDIVQDDPDGCGHFVTHPMIRSLDSVHMRFYLGVLAPFRHIRAKKMLLDVQFQAQIFKWNFIGEFLEHKIRNWLRGEQEIDRIHIITAPASNAEHNLNTLVARVSRLMPDELGWIDRTYQGMELIVRATDGQALIVFFDKPDLSIYLIRCQYNFRRGRCLGSYERNQKSLARIRQLMCIYAKLNEEKPLLAVDAKEKLREECCNFNKYNNGATTVDLATDAIWRPAGKRRSPWGVSRGHIMRGTFPMDRSLRHAYQFTKAFEERDKLKVTQFVDSLFEEKMLAWPRDGIAFLNTRLIRSLERMYLVVDVHHLQHLHRIRANEISITIPMFPFPMIRRLPAIDILFAKLGGWLAGTDEIDKFQIGWERTGWPDGTFEPFISTLKLDPALAHIDRTYEGMTLILRASDGQALIAYFEEHDDYFNLISSEYNFRRGRCLGSYQRNALALARISKLMALSMTLAEKSPALADDAKKKLREECINFNKYNENVSERDLLIDSIWRSKAERRCPWGKFGDNVFLDMTYPVDKNLEHAYKFTKLFEETGVLPEVDHFQPVSERWIDRTYQGMELILRATDGQALIVYFDTVDLSIYLLRCDYNFRRGRCLGSYERNGKALARIRQLMCIYAKLNEEKPLLAADAKEKLMEECINFNKYNNGATTVDLLTDSIWRPAGKRRSPWGVYGGHLMGGAYPVLVDKVAVTLKTEMGWIDRTYEGMELILRASDGQALLVFWDDAHGYFYLIRCEYNFRRGRCLGSYERNEESIRKICDLMRISLQLATLRPALAEDAKEKLKEECIRFTEYNKGATTVDLMIDCIWRPKGDRRSPWVLIDGKILHDNFNPMNFAVLHAYRFVRAFGETGVLPEIHQFQPLDR